MLLHMDDLAQRIDAIEARLKARGVSVARMLRHADITSSTWTRWKAGTTAAPRGQVWSRVEYAADALAGTPAQPPAAAPSQPSVAEVQAQLDALHGEAA
jgi:hypothetical protein